MASIVYAAKGLFELWTMRRRKESILTVLLIIAVGFLLPVLFSLRAESFWMKGFNAVAFTTVFLCWIMSGFFIHDRVRSINAKESLRETQAHLDAGLKSKK